MGRRFALLIAAVVVAALGTVLVFAYVHRADDRAMANQRPTKVLVAKVSIAAGTRVLDAANAGSFEEKEVPASAVVPGALSDITPVKDQVAAGNIFAGQQLITQMFAATAATDSSITIPAGQLAVSFSFGDPQRVAGFVQPGSQVCIFLTSSLSGGAPSTRILLPKVTVIAVGPTTITPPADPSRANPEAQPRAMLTLAVTQLQAEQLIFAQSNGSMYLGLLNDKSQVQSGNGVNARNVFA